MADVTAISWTDHTFNPWWGCTKVSPACDNCYADSLSHRYGFNIWGKDADRRFLSDDAWKKPVKWNKSARLQGKALVFCASMADVFEDRRDLDEARERLFHLIEETESLEWQLLTKRPEKIMKLTPARWKGGFPANVWVGTSVENQRYADLRVPKLLKVPAKIHFLSCEPLLGSVDLSKFEAPEWVICGGESEISTEKRRGLDLGQARNIREQCLSRDIPFFFKQVGGRTSKAGGILLDGKTYHEFPKF